MTTRRENFEEFDHRIGDFYCAGSCPSWDIAEKARTNFHEAMRTTDVILYVGQGTFYHLRFKRKIVFHAMKFIPFDWDYYFRDLEYGYLVYEHS